MLGCGTIHANETPVNALKPGQKGTHRAYPCALVRALGWVIKSFERGVCNDARGQIEQPDATGTVAVVVLVSRELGPMRQTLLA